MKIKLTKVYVDDQEQRYRSLPLSRHGLKLRSLFMDVTPRAKSGAGQEK
jgi:hypothetical protein